MTDGPRLSPSAVALLPPSTGLPAVVTARPSPPSGLPAVLTDGPRPPGRLHRPAPVVHVVRSAGVQPPCADVSPCTRPSIRTGPLPAGSRTASLAMDSIVNDCFTSPLIRARTSLLGIGTVAPVAAVRFS